MLTIARIWRPGEAEDSRSRQQEGCPGKKEEKELLCPAPAVALGALSPLWCWHGWLLLVRRVCLRSGFLETDHEWCGKEAWSGERVSKQARGGAPRGCDFSSLSEPGGGEPRGHQLCLQIDCPSPGIGNIHSSEPAGHVLGLHVGVRVRGPSSMWTAALVSHPKRTTAPPAGRGSALQGRGWGGSVRSGGQGSVCLLSERYLLANCPTPHDYNGTL